MKKNGDFMGRYKTRWQKLRIAKETKSAKPAPRWIDIKVFGLGRARFRSVKRFRSRHWRRGNSKIEL